MIDSTLLTRYLTPFIQADLRERMIFLGDPRRVCKTTLSQSLIESYEDGHPAYLKWNLRLVKIYSPHSQISLF